MKAVTQNLDRVSFSLSSKDQPDPVMVHGAWVIDKLSIPCSKVSKKRVAQQWNHLSDDSGIVLNIVIPPLVASCKILIISVNFLEALAAIGRGDFRLCCCPSQIPIFGVSHCLKCLWCCLQRTMWSMWLTLFYSFVLNPIAVVAAIGQLHRHTFKTWM